MIIANVGKQGMHKEIFHGEKREACQFEPGVNVECSDEMGKYLLDKYNNPKMAIHFQRALDSNEHVALTEAVEITESAPEFELAPTKKKRGRPKRR